MNCEDFFETPLYNIFYNIFCKKNFTLECHRCDDLYNKRILHAKFGHLYMTIKIILFLLSSSLVYVEINITTGALSTFIVYMVSCCLVVLPIWFAVYIFNYRIFLALGISLFLSIIINLTSTIMMLVGNSYMISVYPVFIMCGIVVSIPILCIVVFIMYFLFFVYIKFVLWICSKIFAGILTPIQ